MTDFSLNPDINITVTASFIRKGSDAPITGEGFELRLFDKDLMEDDYLGSSPLDAEGRASIRFSHHSFGDNLNIEQMPDLYFALYKDDHLVFQSKVMEDLDLPALEKFKMGTGEVVDLGTFLVEA
jgi:hypothetical protein